MSLRTTAIAVACFGALVAAVPAMANHDRYSDSSGNYYSGNDSYGQDRPDSAVSYINPDTGAATANPDVNANSSCYAPDRYDVQKLSDAGTANRNVHNDACFLEDSRSGSSWSWGGSSGSMAAKQDAPATFQSTGVGFISACPDPDNAGPKVAITRDTNGDGRIDFCFQSGYQEKGIAGDKEFHARLNNTTTTGRQNVVWCYDPDRDGCADEYIKDTIKIDWVR
jgi:hypothetical protein